MQNKASKQKMNQSLKFIIFLSLIILFLNSRLFSFMDEIRLYALLVAIVFLGGYLIMFIYYQVKSRNKKESSIELISRILDYIDFAEPIDELTMIEDEEIKIEEIQEIIEEKVQDPIEHIELIEPLSKTDNVESVVVEESEPIVQEHTYYENIETQQYVNHLSLFLASYGFVINKSQLINMFASMSATKLIVLKNSKEEVIHHFLDKFSEFIGAHYFSDEIIHPIEQFDDLFKEEYHLKQCVLSAGEHKDRMHLMSFSNVDLTHLNAFFQPILNYANNPLIPCEIQNRHFTDLTHSPLNMWFFLIIKPDQIDEITKDLADSAVVIEFNISSKKPKDVILEKPIRISYESFTHLLLDGYEREFLDESFWKNIDQIEGYYHRTNGFLIDNRLFRQMERFSSTYLLFGGDKQEAIDHLLFSKLLNVLSYVHKKNEDEEDVLLLFERLFGLENLTNSKRILKQIQERNK